MIHVECLQTLHLLFEYLYPRLVVSFHSRKPFHDSIGHLLDLLAEMFRLQRHHSITQVEYKSLLVYHSLFYLCKFTLLWHLNNKIYF